MILRRLGSIALLGCALIAASAKGAQAGPDADADRVFAKEVSRVLGLVMADPRGGAYALARIRFCGAERDVYGWVKGEWVACLDGMDYKLVRVISQETPCESHGRAMPWEGKSAALSSLRESSLAPVSAAMLTASGRLTLPPKDSPDLLDSLIDQHRRLALFAFYHQEFSTSLSHARKVQAGMSLRSPWHEYYEYDFENSLSSPKDVDVFIRECEARIKENLPDLDEELKTLSDGQRVKHMISNMHRIRPEHSVWSWGDLDFAAAKAISDLGEEAVAPLLEVLRGPERVSQTPSLTKGGPFRGFVPVKQLAGRFLRSFWPQAEAECSEWPPDSLEGERLVRRWGEVKDLSDEKQWEMMLRDDKALPRAWAIASYYVHLDLGRGVNSVLGASRKDEISSLIKRRCRTLIRMPSAAEWQGYRLREEAAKMACLAAKLDPQPDIQLINQVYDLVFPKTEGNVRGRVDWELLLPLLDARLSAGDPSVEKDVARLEAAIVKEEERDLIPHGLDSTLWTWQKSPAIKRLGQNWSRRFFERLKEAPAARGSSAAWELHSLVKSPLMGIPAFRDELADYLTGPSFLTVFSRPGQNTFVHESAAMRGGQILHPIERQQPGPATVPGEFTDLICFLMANYEGAPFFSPFMRPDQRRRAKRQMSDWLKTPSQSWHRLAQEELWRSVTSLRAN